MNIKKISLVILAFVAISLALRLSTRPDDSPPFVTPSVGDATRASVSADQLPVTQPAATASPENSPPRVGDTGGSTIAQDNLPPVPEGVPLTSIYDELLARAAKGDQQAACRLMKEMEGCRRYQEHLLTFKGKLGPYEKAESMDVVDSLDQQILGMPMESAALVCEGFDRRGHHADSESALLTARRKTNAAASLQAAIELQLLYKEDPENIRIVTERATNGDLAAIKFLSSEYSLSHSFYGRQAVTKTRTEENLKWLIVLKHMVNNVHDKNNVYQREIDTLSAQLDATSRNKIIGQAEAFARLNFVENSYQPKRNESMYSLDSEFCGN